MPNRKTVWHQHIYYFTEDDEANEILKKDGMLMKAKGLSKTSTSRYISHQMYVDQVLKDQEAISCKMSNNQSRNFRMYTQYIYKKALVNYENKRYWLDSIYSLPFGHPWIAKIEEGSMSLEEAIDRIAGEKEYTYELSVCNKKAKVDKKQEEIKLAALERKEEVKKKFISNDFASVTNLGEKEINIIADPNGIKPGLNKLLSNPVGLKMMERLLGGGKLKGRQQE